MNIYDIVPFGAQENAFKKILRKVALVIFAALLFMMPIIASAQGELPKTPEQKILEKIANKALWWLNFSVKNYGFVSSRISLNVWKSAAIEAGTFDEAFYKETYEKIYKDSIESNQRCVEIYSQMGDFKNASTCLHIWKIHTTELGVFDEEKYDLLSAMIKQ